MTFVSPAWLLLLLLGPLIVFFHSRPRRDVEVSSLLIWRHAASAAPPRASPQLPPPNVLMVLQLLVLALIALALARPVMTGRLAETDHWIVLVDASSSMQAAVGGTTRFGEARDYLASELRRADGTLRRVSLVRVASQPSVVGARLTRPAQVLAALETLQPSHAPAEWGQVASLLPGLLLEGERTRVTILSDAASAGARAAIADALPELTVESMAFGRPTGNTALARVTPVLLDAGGGRWRVSGEIHTFAVEGEASQDRTVPMRVLFTPEDGNGALEWATSEIELGGERVTPFAVEVALPGPGLLEVQLADDDLPLDNRAHFVLYGAPRQVRVLYVGGGNPPLERAFEAVEGVVVTRAAAVPESAAEYDLVVVDGVAASSRPGTSTVWLGIAPGGGDTPQLADPSPNGWLDGHPLARSVDWSALSVRAARHFPLLPGAEVVLESSGLPLVQARTTRDGREVAIAFALADTDWPELLGFPVFVANLLRWAAPDAGSAVGTPCNAGFPCPLEPGELAGEGRVVGPDSELPLPSFFLTGGDDAPGEAWLPRAMEGVFTPQQSGVHIVESDQGRRAIAVNALFPAEADLSAAGGDDPGPQPAARPASSSLPIWSWLLLLAVAALSAEGWIAGRSSERFLRKDGLARGNPLAGRRRLVLALHAASLALLLLAILDFRGLFPVREAGAILVVDDAGMQGEAVRGAAQSFISSAGAEANRARRFGLVRVGPEGRVTSDVGADLDRPELRSAELPGADLEAGLQLAGALLPRESAGRIVLVTDGSETRGTVAGALPALLARQVPIDVYMLPGQRTDDVAVAQVALPGVVHPNEVARLEGVITSDRRTTGTVRLWREGVLDTERTIEVLPGRNRVDFEIAEEVSGAYLYEIEVVAAGDEYPENDRNGLLVEVGAAPRIAIVTPQLSWGQSLADALSLQGVSAEVMTPDQAPQAPAPDGSGLSRWSDFDVIALMNVPASDLSPGTMEELERWVRDTGGGLILLGGENTFGPGGYFETPLEDLSPLSARIPQELPNLAIVFSLDRSGSMALAAGGGSRLDMVKVATLEAIRLLDPESLVGIVAFDSQAQIIVPIQPAGEFENIRARLQRLQPGGGTYILPGLGVAYGQLSQVDPDFRRHIVLMTDGQSQRGSFGAMVEVIVGAGMTISTAAVGLGADVDLLEGIARQGGGAAHVTTDFGDLASILASEASRFSSEPVREEPMTPVWRSRDAPFLQAFPDQPPDLQGHVRTTLKPGARAHLEADDDIPLLASWRYGLGRVVAFASHGAGPWAADWMAAPDYAIWWAQVVRWAVPGAAGPGLHVQVARDKDYGRVVVEAVRPDGGPNDGLELEAAIATPGAAQPVSTRLREVEPGLYVGSFIADLAGTYTVSVGPGRGARGSTIETVERRLHVGYPARYEFSRSDADLLQALAQASGGRMLSGDERIFDGGVPIQWTWRSMWPVWALLALAVFMIELFRRYGAVRSARFFDILNRLPALLRKHR